MEGMLARYAKHHGLGNDFLVSITDLLPDDAADRAVALCDRRTGIGADGLLYGITSDELEISMRLFNSDGSTAEVSGNGLRCLAQAVARHRGVNDLEIDIKTPAGNRHCTVRATDRANTVVATVDMGVVTAGPVPDVEDLMAAVSTELWNNGRAVNNRRAVKVRRWETANIGNPHVICEVADVDEIALDVAGPAIEAHFAGGINVSFVEVVGRDQLKLRVWERGAGITSACGTGATVASYVFNRWRLVTSPTTVRMPGGEAVVDLSGPLTLSGPATHVGDIEFEHG